MTTYYVTLQIGSVEADSAYAAQRLVLTSLSRLKVSKTQGWTILMSSADEEDTLEEDLDGMNYKPCLNFNQDGLPCSELADFPREDWCENCRSNFPAPQADPAVEQGGAALADDEAPQIVTRGPNWKSPNRFDEWVPVEEDPRIARAEMDREDDRNDYGWIEDSPDNPNVPER
jgi:hypothetical protein